MNALSPTSAPTLLRVFIASLLSFALLTTPLASAASLAYAANTAPTKPATKSANKALEDSLFVKQPSAAPAAETPAPQAPTAPSLTIPGMPVALAAPPPPPPGVLTATMAAVLTATANNGNGQADPGDTITYTVTLDNQTGSDATALGFSVPIDSHTTLTSNTLNSTPVAFDQAVPAFSEDASAQNITLQGQDPDGSNVTFSIVGSPTHGTLGNLANLNSPTCAADGVCSATITYTPNANYNSGDGAESFTFKVNDGTANSNENGTVSITVNAVNDAPTFTTTGNPAASNEDAGAQSVNNFVTNINAGAPNESGQTVSFEIVSNSNSALFSTQPAIDSAGKLTYTAAPDKNGTATITYHAKDNGGTANGGVDTSSPDQTFTITVNPVNDKPVYSGAQKTLTVQSQMQLQGATGLLAGVTDPDANDPGFSPQTLQVDPTTIDTTNCKNIINGTTFNCQITVTDVNAGTFNIDPPPGVGNGTVLSFTYKVKDNGNPAPGVLSDPISVNVTVQGPIIWFVNPNAASNGIGTLSSPFKTLASATDSFHLGNLGTDQRVFVYSGTTEAGVGVTLSGVLTSASVNQSQARTKAQWLVGQGVAGASFDTVMGIVPPAGTIARPTIGGTRPIIRGTVTMKENTFLAGLNIDVISGSSKGISASSLSAGTAGSTIDVQDVNVLSSSGNAVDFNSAQTLNYTTSNQTSSPNVLSSTTGIALSVVGTTIGSGGMTFKSISANGAQNGIVLNTTGNTGAFIVTGDGSTGSTKCAGGTGTAGLLDCDGSGGTIQNTTQDGVKLTNVSNVTLKQMKITNAGWDGVESTGSSNVVLSAVDINHPGNGNPASDGSTGNAAGFGGGNGWYAKEMTGTNSFDNNSRVINWQSSQSNAVVLYNTNTNFTSFTVDDVLISTSATGAAGFNANLNGSTTGTVTLTDSEYTLIDQNGAQILNNGSGTVTAIVKRNNFHDADNTGGDGNNTLFLSNSNSGVLNFTIGADSNANLGGNPTLDRNTFKNLARLTTLAGVIQVDAAGGSNVTPNGGRINGTIRNNTITNDVGFVNGRRAIDIQVEMASHNHGAHSVLIADNTATNISKQAVSVTLVSVGGGSLTSSNFTIKNNTFTNVGTEGNVDSGSGIEFETNADAVNTGATINSNVLIQNNTVQNNNSSAVGSTLEINSRALGGTNTSNLQLTIWGNSLTNSNGSGEVFEALTSDGNGGAKSSICLDMNADNIAGNRNTYSGGGASGFKLSGNATGGTFSVAKMSAGAQTTGNVQSYVSTRNNSLTVTAAGSFVGSPGGCTLSSASLTTGENQRDDLAQVEGGAQGSDASALLAILNISPEFASAIKASDHQVLDSTASPAQSSAALGTVVPEPTTLHAEQPTSTTAAEEGFWNTFALAAHAETSVPAEANAARQNDAPQTNDYGALVAKASFQPMAETVKTVEAAGGSVPSEEASLSHAPAHRATEAKNATANASLFAPPTPPGAFPVNGTGSGFRLPTGKTVTITFKVTVNNPPNLTGVTPPKVSFQGTLQGSVGTILTDDPSTGTAGDATVTLVDLFDTTSTITGASPSNSTSTGQAVTFTASIVENNTPDPAGGTLPSGTATFKDNGSDIAGCVGVTVTAGAAQCTTSALTTGTHNNITVVYSGDGNFDPSTSAAFTQTVTQSGTSVTVTSSLNPSLVTQDVTFTATVASTGGNAGPPTGTVTFKDGANPITCSNAGGQTLNGSGVATCQIATLAAGNHNITAVYSGDTNFTGNTGTLTGDPQVVNKSGTTLNLGTSGSPTTPGTTVTFTATINSATAVNVARTGTVTFYDGTATPGNEITACGASGVVTVSSNQATCATSTLSEATHTITAVYSGDATYSSSSNTVQQVVAKNATTTTLVDSAPAGSSPGDNVTFTATVTSSAGTPTGTVQFLDGATPLACDNGGDTQTLDGSGMATCQTNDLTTAGSPHSITAVYAGTATFSGSTSNVVSHAVNSCLATTIVTNTNDSGTGSLRDAISRTCADGTVTFSNTTAGGVTNFYDGTPRTITLTSAPLDIALSMTIQGPGANAVTVSGNDLLRVFTVQSSFTVNISGLTITKGKAPEGTAGNPGGNGGAITNSGTLTLTNVTVSNSHAGNGGDGSGSPGGAGGNGGGIFNDGTLYVFNSTISGNQTGAGGTGSPNGSGGSGGGIYNTGNLGFNGSTISGNKAFGAGGGIASASGTLTLFNTTVFGNTANGEGGGILNSGTSTASLANSTITANRSDNDNDLSGEGGGISQTSSNNPSLFNTIVAGNFKGNAVGVKQSETITVTGTANVNGNIIVRVTAAGMTGSPKNVSVAVSSGDSASTVATNIVSALTADSNVGAFFDVNIGSNPEDVVLTVKTAAANDPTMHVKIFGNSTGIQNSDSTHTTGGVAPSAGTKQIETLKLSNTVGSCGTGGAGEAGTLTLTVTASGLTGSGTPMTVNIANGDDASTVAGKIRTFLAGGDPQAQNVAGFFDIGGSGPDVTFTKKTAAADDATLVVTISPDAPCAGISSTSEDTQAGVAPSAGTAQQETVTVAGGPVANDGTIQVTVTAAGMSGSPKTVPVAVTTGDSNTAVAGKIVTALNNDADIGGFFTAGNSGANVTLTRNAAAADDPTMHVAIVGNATGIQDADSSPTTAGVFQMADDINGSTNAGSSSFNLIGTGGAGGLTNGTNNNQVGVDPATVFSAGLANNGGPTQTAALKSTSTAIDAGNSTSAGLTTLSAGIDNVTTTVSVTDAGMIPVGVGYTILVDSEQMVITAKNANTLTVTRGANSTTAAAHSSGAEVYPAIDQRGLARPVNFDGNPPAVGNDSDIGAYEQQTQTAAPNAPDLDAASDTGASSTDNVTGDTSPTFTIGGVISGATVKLYRDDDGGGPNPATVVATGTASGTSIQLTDPGPLSAGTYVYSATQTIGGAPESVQSATLSITIDSSAPGVPGTPDLQDASDTGLFNNDNITKATTRVFDITNTDSGATVELIRDTASPGGSPVVVASGTGNGGTLPLTDSTAAPDNTYVYTSRQTNGVGASTPSAGSLNVTIDTVAPVAPTTPDLQAASDSGTSNTDNYTNASARAFDIAGTTLNARVELYRGATFVGFATGNGGTVTITDNAAIADSTYSYSAQQVDLAGNFATSGTLSVTLDTVSAPSIPDLQAASDSGASNSDNITKTTPRAFDIVSTENSATVELLRGGSPVTSTTGNGGTVTLSDSAALADNTYAYATRQTDLAGNVGTSSALNVTLDTTATANAPDLDAASDTGASNTDNRTGASTRTFNIAIAQAGSTVELLRGGTAVANTTGTGSVQLSDTAAIADGTYQYAVRETDLAGNVATSSNLDVIFDTTAPSVASVTRANPSPTSATSVQFTVTFSEAVQVAGVDATDFQLTTTGGISLIGSPITAVTPVAPGGTPNAATQFTVTVDTGTGDGTIRLDVLGNGSIKDLMDLPFNGPTFTSGEIYSVVKSNPAVVSINTANPNPTNQGSVDFTVTFNKPVTGVNIGANSDFQLVTSGVAGASITNLNGSGTTYTVTVNTGTGDGTVGLNLVDDDTIIDGANKPLGGAGANNGDFTGQVYTVDKTVPVVNSVVKASGQADPAQGPTSSTVINFTVTFSEAVTGFDSTDITITGTAGATVANITEVAPNNGTTYNVGVEGMTQTGSVTIQVKANAVFDQANNTNAASGTATVQFIKDNFTSFEVNSTADTDDGSCDPLGTGNGCTLREAINLANNDGGAETITFNIPGADAGCTGGVCTIQLGTVLPDLSSDMTITGTGANVLKVARNSGTRFRIFNVTSGVTVSISGLTITGGFTLNGAPGQPGGGIRNAGTLTLTGVAVSGNQTGQGAGCANCTGGNGGDGGGISNTGTLIIANSTISGNQAGIGGDGFSGNGIGGNGGNGGGIFNGGTLTITNSTVSGNQVGAGGTGAMGNGVGGQGGGISSNGTLTIANSTITNNTATSNNGGGIRRSGGTVTLRSTIVAGNSATTAPDIEDSALNSEGFNLIGNTSGVTINETQNAGTNITGQPAQLSPLADNGGPTQTHALQCTSPAIDKGKAFGLTTDQRGLGFTRPFDLSDAKYPNAGGGDGSDIGAFEVQSGAGCVPVATPPNPQPSVTNEDTPVTLTLTGTYSQNTPLTFTITQNPVNGTLGSVSAPVCNFTTVQTCTATVQYSPNPNFNGSDSFKFKVSAGAIDSEDTDVAITVTPSNDAPQAGATQNLTTDEDTALPIQLSGSDIDSPTLTFTISASPSHGTLSAPTVNCGAGNCTADLTYTPNANYNGPDQFKYKVSDGSLSSADAIVNINVHSIADTPSVTPATTTINKQTTSGLVISRNAVDGSEIGTFKITNIQNGTLFKNNGTTQISDGQFITFAEGNAGLKFTPNHNLVSPSTTFSFDVQAANNGAGDGLSPAATATIIVNCNATSVVTNSNDSGAGSLRDVIFNACPGGTITFNIPTSDPGYNASTGVTTISLTTDELLIDRDLTITGTGANKLTVKRDAAAPNFRIFNISPAATATVNISGMTITGGIAPASSVFGGAIRIAMNAPGQVKLDGVAVTNSTAAGGGGIFTLGGGTLNVVNSLIANNTATSDRGGAIQNFNNLVVINSTISGNSSVIDGGGINSFGPSLVLTNSTITNNRSDSDNNSSGTGGGLRVLSAPGTTTLNNNIIAGNFMGTGSTADDFSDPGGSTNVAASFNNLVGIGGGLLNPANGNQLNVANAGLAALADNGGPTLTHLLLPSSPAIDKGNNSKAVDQTNAALTTDQRGTGFARISNTTVDIGALEVSYANTATAGTPQSAIINAAFSTQLQATIKENGILKANIPVTFTAPASGASGTFQGSGTSVTVNTDAQGVATAPVFTANGIAGSYNVVASLATGQPTSTFALTNNTAATSTVVTSSVNPSDFGETVTFTATVSSSAGTPTGTVQFLIDGANAGSPVTLAGGVATFSTSSLAVGNHSVAVSYAGDGNYQPSSATLTGGQQVVNAVPTLSINDVTQLETNSGTTAFNFTVTLSASSHLTVKVDYATADGTATTADSDYQAKTGTLTFTPGQTTQTITVLVNGDTKAEANENFFVNLSNSVNADISDNQGVGSILSEDTPIVEFSASSYTVAESGLHATITVNRLGDLSKAATVDYATTDPSGLNNCSQITGNASQRCDYATVVGTLRFAANESSKTIFIPIVNDVYVEGPEFFTITLSNLQGVEFGAVPSATVNITDDDNGVQQNPIVNDAFFIRQLYIDFLGREPEPAGLQGWLDILHNANGQCKVPTDCDRIAVALGFVQSPEFQARGYFTFRFYTAALGRNPKYSEFIPDVARLSGFLNPAEVEANKNDFVSQFMSRQEFKSLYDPTIGDPTSYVDKLLQTAGLPNHPARNAWIAGLSNNSLTRAQVLRQFIESTEVYTKFYNQAIIVMNYFGFLRRDPDAAYQAWIDIFNHTNDYRVITNGFINSPEYPLRFGP